MVTCFITFDDLSGHSYPFTFLMLLNFLYIVLLISLAICMQRYTHLIV